MAARRRFGIGVDVDVRTYTHEYVYIYIACTVVRIYHYIYIYTCGMVPGLGLSRAGYHGHALVALQPAVDSAGRRWQPSGERRYKPHLTLSIGDDRGVGLICSFFVFNQGDGLSSTL